MNRWLSCLLFWCWGWSYCRISWQFPSSSWVRHSRCPSFWWSESRWCGFEWNKFSDLDFLHNNYWNRNHLFFDLKMRISHARLSEHTLITGGPGIGTLWTYISGNGQLHLPSLPASPTLPCSPTKPIGPTIPIGPRRPGGPTGPWSPGEPLAPGNPVSLWLFSEQY